MKSSDTHTRTGLKPWMLDAIRETIASDARVDRAAPNPGTGTPAAQLLC